MRQVVAVVVSLLVALVVAAAIPSRAPATVALPPPGSLTAGTTSAGTPVWIGHRRDDGSAVAGDVWVVEAAAPGSTTLVAWCPVTGQLVDPRTGDRFDPRGRVVEAATATGLTPLRVERRGALLVVTERLPAYPDLGLGAADTADGEACTAEQLVRHPAT